MDIKKLAINLQDMILNYYL